MGTARIRYCPRCNAKHPGGQHVDSRDCPTCGEHFQPRHAKTVYCSRRCAGIARRRPTATKTCVKCGNLFEQQPEWGPSYWEKRLYCSLACRGNGRSPAIAKCGYCGEEFTVKSSRRKFCSTDCFQASRHLQPSMRPTALGNFSDACKALLMERANYGCERCGSKEHLELDHVIPRAAGGDGTLENGQVLCRVHHLEKSQQERTLVRTLLRSHYGLTESS